MSKNQARLLEGEIAREFLQAVVSLADETDLLSNEHFTVDGTLPEAAASLKSFKPRAIPRSISERRSARMTRMSAQRTRKPGCTRKDRGKKPN